MTTSWLVDKSAYVRLGMSPEAELWAARIERGLVRICTATALEIGFSARSAEEWNTSITRPPLASMPREHARPQSENRALEVQGILALRGHHRAPSVPDLLVAAIAEVGSLTVLHVDRDFELIAEITGQPVERLT